MRPNLIRRRMAGNSAAYLMLQRRRSVSAREDRYKNRALGLVTKACRQYNTAELAQLSSNQLSHVIEYACRKDILTDVLRDLITSFLPQGELILRDLFHILLVAPQNNKWQDIKRGVIDFLRNNPQHAFLIMTMAKQKLNWPEPTFCGKREGELHNCVFVRTAKITIENQPYKSHECSATSIQDAERLALVNLFSIIVGLDTGPLHISNSVKDGLKEDVNYKGKLFDLWQKNTHNGWENPDFNSREKDLHSPSPGWRSQVAITISGSRIISIECIGVTKIDAEQMASKKLLEMLKHQ